MGTKCMANKNTHAVPYVTEDLVKAVESRFTARVPSTDDSYNNFIAFSAYHDVVNQLKAWQKQTEKEGMPNVHGGKYT